MIAWINGIMVKGSPEEIEKYRMIASEKKTSTRPYDDIPEHVKQYDKYNATYVSKGQTHRVWL
jgi:hypothetical protein